MTRPRFLDSSSLTNTLIERVTSVRIVHHIESVFIAFSLPIFITVIIFGLHVDSCIHEWANFLKHYDAASPAARHPVELLAILLFLVSLAVVVFARRNKKGAQHG